jgi:hypothetical protein
MSRQDLNLRPCPGGHVLRGALLFVFYGRGCRAGAPESTKKHLAQRTKCFLSDRQDLNLRPCPRGHVLRGALLFVFYGRGCRAGAPESTKKHLAQRTKCFLSDRQDLNLRPLPPQGSALPSCATARKIRERLL